MTERQVQELLAKDRRYVWHPFTQMLDYERGEEPVLFTHGKGSWLYDGRGRRYLDAVSSMWIGTLGHNHPALNKALQKQMEKVAHTTLLGATNPAAIELAAELVQVTPKGMDHVFYSDNGSTAVEVAIKMAYQVMARRHEAAGRRGKPPGTFLTYKGAYHGDTIGSVSVGGVDIFHATFKPLLFQSLQLPYPAWPPLGVAPTKKGEKVFLRQALAKAEAVIKRHHKKLVGVIMEPGVQGVGGIQVMVPGYLKGLRKLLDRYGLLLVADEVATGFCRTGPWFAVDGEGVIPDLMALGKGLTGGYLPIAATVTTGEVFQAFVDDYEKARHFFHGHTFTGNPLAAAVALENLKHMSRPTYQRALAKRQETFQQAIAPLAEHPLVGQVRLKGFMGGLELVRGKNPIREFPWEERIGHHASLRLRAQEIFMRPLGSVVVLMPPLCLSASESRHLAKGLRAVFDELYEETRTA